MKPTSLTNKIGRSSIYLVNGSRSNGISAHVRIFSLRHNLEQMRAPAGQVQLSGDVLGGSLVKLDT